MKKNRIGAWGKGSHDCPQTPSVNLESGANGAPAWKRGLDMVVLVLTAPGWLPVMAVTAVAIKVVSGGDVLFRQERIGLGGKRFVCLKFRTMHSGCTTAGHEQYFAQLIQSDKPMKKLDGEDRRLIPGAWILRSTGLDELPQILNVIRGEMSVVGPRPCTPAEFDAYSEEQRARTDTLPGLTGLWQVSGKNNTTFSQMIQLDIRYAKTASLGQDLSIMLRTPLVLIRQLAESLAHRHQKTLAANARPQVPAKPRAV